MGNPVTCRMQRNANMQGFSSFDGQVTCEEKASVMSKMEKTCKKRFRISARFDLAFSPTSFACQYYDLSIILTLMKLKHLLLLISIFYSFFISQAFGHCQVPCGVYTDQLRFDQMLEDQKTIEKASKLILELSGKKDAQSQNQLSRWVVTKESHASNIQKTVAEYFLIQRIKSSSPYYEKLLVASHGVLVSAMKAKQNVDTETAKSLKDAILNLQKVYEHKI